MHTIRTSNKNAREAVQKRLPFKASNTFGEWKGNGFAVYSYGYHFPMFLYDSVSRVWFKNADKYSVSTSRQQSQLNPLADGMSGMDTKGMLQRISELNASTHLGIVSPR